MPHFCESCGTPLSPSAGFCSGCGSKIVAGPVPFTRSSISPQAPEGRQEEVLFDEEGVKVTSARLLVDQQTYAMSGITSVRTEVERPSKLGPLVTIVIGALALTNAATVLIGLVVVVVGVLWFRSRRPQYEVVLTTAAGEQQPVESSDRDFVEKIVTAINDAIVHRG